MWCCCAIWPFKSRRPRCARRDFALATAALDQAEKLGQRMRREWRVTRAILLFETGKKEEALDLARKTLAAAQGEKEKAKAEPLLRTMEARIEAAKTNQTMEARPEAAKTNQAVAPDPGGRRMELAIRPPSHDKVGESDAR